MYRGFNLKYNLFQQTDYDIGTKLYSSYAPVVQRKLNEYLINGKFDASLMLADWFPALRYDVFISHSHKDSDSALTLAGWLYRNFRLKSFVDSCVWDNADILLKSIDDSCCKSTKTGYYNYSKRNSSTSHVHMMLATSLMKVIDKAECVIFLNTDNSITSTELIDQTESPWIYAEIMMTKYLRQNPPVRLITESIPEMGDIEHFEKAKPKFTYIADLSHLTALSKRDLSAWINYCNIYPKGTNALDLLYSLRKPAK